MAKSGSSKRFWKWTLGTVAVLGVVGLPTAYFGGRYYLRQRTLGWRKEGMAAAAAGDNEKAADLLARYIHKNGDDVDALEAFIGAREQVELPNGQHISETLSALKMVLGVAPDRLQDREHLLKLYVRVQRRPEALDTANAILSQISKLPKPAADASDIKTIKAETLGLEAGVLMGLHQERDALNITEQWIAATPPGTLPPQMMRIDLRLRIGQPLDSIIKESQAYTAAHPKDAGAELLVGYALVHAGGQQQQEAATWFRSAARDADPHSEVAQILVAQFDSLGVATDAIAVLQELVDRGADVTLRHTLACRYWEQEKWQQCVDLLADVKPEEAKSDATLLALKEIALSHLSKTADAAACNTGLTQKKSSAAQAWLLIMARISQSADADDKKIIEATRQALLLNSHDPYLQYFLGDAYYRIDEADLAIDSWKQAMALGPTWNLPPWHLVQALLKKGDPRLALQIAVIAHHRNPTNASGTIALARAWAACIETGDVGDADNLLKLVNEVQAQIPGEEQTLLIRVQLLAKSGKTVDAVAAARAALALTPPPGEQFLITLAAIGQKYNLGIEDDIFNRDEKSHGNTANVAYARAASQFLAGNAAAGLVTFDQAAARPDRTGEPFTWKLARARYLDISNDKNAATAWLAVSDEFPANLTVQTVAASAKAVVGNWDIMSKIVDRLHAITGDKELQWRLAQGRLYVECARNEDDYLKGSLILNTLVKDYPALPESHVLLARTLVHMNRIDGAMEHMQLATRLDPNSVPTSFELIGLFCAHGDFDKARVELNRIVPLLHTAQEFRMAAIAFSEIGDVDKAVAIMEQPVVAKSTPQNDLLMAMLYNKQGQLGKAEAIIKLLLAKPDLATVQFAASFYLAQGKQQETEKTLGLLDQLKLNPGIKELIWGAYYLQTGNAADSIAQYQAATKKAPQNPATWRTLAAACMAVGKKDDAITAIKEGAKALPDDKGMQKETAETGLLREALDDPGLAGVVMIYHRDPLAGDADLEMIKLVTDAQHANDMSRMAAQLQQFIERHADFMPAYIRLAECYADMNRVSDALTAAMHAMSVFPNEPEPARIATQIAASSQRWAEMRTAAESWKKRSNDPAADVSIARALVGLGQYEEARNQLRPSLAAAKAKPDQYSGVLVTYASALVNLGQDKEADGLLWPLAQKDVRWRVAWIDVALTFQDAKKTIAWFDKVNTAIPADASAERLGIAEGLDKLSRRTNDPQWIQKAAQISASVAEQAPQNLVAQLTAGTEAESVGDVKAAELFYRKALKLDANQWVANNNLAMLILKRAGDPKEAVDCARIAAKAQPRSANIYDTLALAESKAGDPKSAVATMQTALKLVPDNLTYQVRLAEYLLDSGQQSEAMVKIREIDQNSGSAAPLDKPTTALLTDIRKRVKM